MIAKPSMSFNLPVGGLSIAKPAPTFKSPIPEPVPQTGGLSFAKPTPVFQSPIPEAPSPLLPPPPPSQPGGLSFAKPAPTFQSPTPEPIDQPPPGMERNPYYKPSNRLSQDVRLSDFEYRPIQGGTIAPGTLAPLPMRESPGLEKPSYSFTPEEGYIENPYYFDRFSDGRAGTFDFQFTDQKYITPESLKNYQDQLHPNTLKILESGRLKREAATPPLGTPTPSPVGGSKPLPDFTLSGPAPTLPSVTGPSAPPSDMVFTQALIPGEQNGVPGYYTDGSMTKFVPYSQTPDSQGDNMYAGGGNLYNPETGQFENITTGATPVATTTPAKTSGGSVTDFLFEGSPPTPGTARETSRTELPEWYTEYATDMLARARGAADMPYEAFPGPRIAPFTPTEREGMEVTKRAAGAYEPFLGQAGDILGQVGGKSSFGAAAPFIGEGAGYTRESADVSAMPTAERYFQEALARTPTGAAAPYAEQAARMFPEAAEAYMSPYTKGVIEELGNVGLEQLQEKYLPQIGEEFIRAGQFGGSRMGEFGARALRDVQRSILGEQRKALESGYKTAADIYGTDVGRQAELARLMGTLGGQEQEFMGDVGKSLAGIQQEDLARILRAGGQLGEFGKIAGALGSEDLDRLLNISGRYADIAGLAQKYGLGAGEAISGVGEKERAMQQANLELAYKDFLEQRGYPKEQVEFMARMLSGIRLPETQISETVTTPATPAGETGIEKIIGGARGGLELIDAIEKLFGKGD